MRLVRVKVDHFRAIDHADVELGPGLNVLYGPNDLGKSTLASAIRAALLLPPGSVEGEKYASWTSELPPVVTLTFEHDAHYRVVKKFAPGSGGSVTLERSRDGARFEPDSSGRQVEEKLRKMLDWGIPPPGLKKGVRGLPQAFLAQVLLAEQTDVDGILGESFTADASEDGRLRLTKALEAFAVDPRFKRALNFAQEEVDRHFTATGQRSRKHGAPIVRAAEAVQELRIELEQHEARAKDSEVVQRRVRDLGTIVEQLAEARAAAELVWRSAAARFEEHGAYVRAREEHDRAAAALADAELKKKLAAERAEQVAAQDRALVGSEEAVKYAAEQRDRLAEAVDRARDAVTRAASDSAAAARAIEKSEIANEISGLDLELEKARSAATLAEKVAEIAARHGQATAQLAALEARASGASKTRDEALLVRQQLEDLRAYVRWSDATRARDEAAKLRAQAASIEVRELPDAAAAASIHALAREIELAEARLGGGLSLTVRASKRAKIEVRADGVAVEVGDGAIAADRKIEVSLASVELEIVAGAAELRRAIEGLKARWAAEAQPVLARGECATAAELVSAVDLQAKRAVLVAEAERIEARAPAVDDAALAGKDRTKLAALASKLPASWGNEAEKTERQLAASIEAARVEEQKAREKAAEERARVSAAAEELARAGSAPELASARASIGSLEQRRAAAVKKLGALDASGSATLEKAKAKLGEATKARDEAIAKLEVVEARLREARSTRDNARGEARLLEQVAAALPHDALARAAREAQAALALLPRASITAEDVEAARVALERADQLLRGKQQEHAEARGALKEVGGTAAEERRAELDLAHTEAKDRQREIELDADAWKLLSETLKESAAAGSQHVGKVLADRIAPRFSALTHRRYGGLDLGPNLETVGVRTSHGNQSPDVLSVGTREQLATLLRLVIAEALETTVILDDHLVQTDPERLGWFVDALADAAKKVQVIVVTCRPNDYESARKIEGVAVKWVDLAKQIKRAAAVIAAPEPEKKPDARALPDLLRASLGELNMSATELAAAVQAGARVVESWVEGRAAPVGSFRARLAAVLGAGAPPGSARAQASRLLS